MTSFYDIFTYSSNYINQIISNKEKNTILDPLTCIIKLGILNFKPKGTKISINNNRITYHEPSLLQGTIRWSQGDAREDLHNLCYPIEKATKWYDLSNPTLKNIFVFGKNGIINLSESYSKNSTTSHSLNHYINIINKSINNPDKTNINDTNENKIYKELKSLWNEREISIVNNLLIELSQNNRDIEKKNTLIQTLDTFLYVKENAVYKLLTDTSTILI